MKFKKGETYYIIGGLKRLYKIHICAVIDTNRIVYKYYGKHKQWWHYFIEHKDILEIQIERAKEIE